MKKIYYNLIFRSICILALVCFVSASLPLASAFAMHGALQRALVTNAAEQTQDKDNGNTVFLKKIARIFKTVEGLKKTGKSPLIICIQGKVSSGKTGIATLFKKSGIGSILPGRINVISSDSVEYRAEFDDEKETKIFSDDLILARDSDVVIIEGLDAPIFINEKGIDVDVEIIMEANEQTRLKRHMKRYGGEGGNFVLVGNEGPYELTKKARHSFTILNNEAFKSVYNDLKELYPDMSLNEIARQLGLTKNFLQEYEKLCFTRLAFWFMRISSRLLDQSADEDVNL